MIGVGITTRNRPETLDWSLQHFRRFKSISDSYFIVVDDNSDYENFLKNKSICEKYGINFIYNHNRKGIAGSKNECAKHLNTDYIFLFDDDCYPRKEGWDGIFINASIKTGIKHFTYTRDIHYIECIYCDENIKIFNHCLGVCNFFTKECFDAIGGYDEEYGLYGYEHADISQRAWHSGCCGEIKGYYSPVGVEEHLYSLDIDFAFKKELTELGEHKFLFKPLISTEPISDYMGISGSVWEKKKKF